MALISLCSVGLAGAVGGLVVVGTHAQTQALLVPLAAVYFGALVGSVALGLGLAEVLPDRMLRRFPLARLEIVVSRSLLGLLDPIWLAAFAFYAGCAVGLGVMSNAPLVTVSLSLSALAVTNFLLARLLVICLTPAATVRAQALMMAALLNGGLMVVLALPTLSRHSSFASLAHVVHALPPGLAVLTIGGVGAGQSGTWLTLWVLLLGLGLGLLASRAVDTSSHDRDSTRITRWRRGSYDVLASAFFWVSQPLLGTFLRFYLRHARVRVALLFSFPFGVWVLYALSSSTNQPVAGLGPALVVLPWIATVPTASVAVNCFAVQGSGLRRVLLTPADTTTVVRALATAPIAVGSVHYAIAVCLWVVVVPGVFDARATVMLLSEGLIVMLVFGAITLGASVFFASPAEYDHPVRRGYSAAANGALYAGSGVVLLVPLILRNSLLAGPLLAHWWLPLAVLPVVIVAHEYGVRRLARRLVRHRERLLSAAEMTA